MISKNLQKEVELGNTAGRFHFPSLPRQPSGLSNWCYSQESQLIGVDFSPFPTHKKEPYKCQRTH